MRSNEDFATIRAVIATIIATGAMFATTSAFGISIDPTELDPYDVVGDPGGCIGSCGGGDSGDLGDWSGGGDSGNGGEGSEASGPPPSAPRAQDGYSCSTEPEARDAEACSAIHRITAFPQIGSQWTVYFDDGDHRRYKIITQTGSYCAVPATACTEGD